MEKDYKLYKLVWNKDCSKISVNTVFNKDHIVRGIGPGCVYSIGESIECTLRDGTEVDCSDVPKSALTEYHENPLVEYLMCL